MTSLEITEYLVQYYEICWKLDGLEQDSLATGYPKVALMVSLKITGYLVQYNEIWWKLTWLEPDILATEYLAQP